MTERPAGLPRALLLFLSLAMIVDTSAYAAITPLLPGLADEYGLSKGDAGLVSGAYAAGTLALALPAAWIATRIGAKRTLIGGLGCLAVASAAFALATSAHALIGARLVQGFGAAAVWAGALAWLVAVVPRERRAEAIGAAVGAAIAGAIGGPALGALADRVGIAVVYGAFVALPVAMILWALRVPAARGGMLITRAALRSAASDPRLRGGMWLMTVPAIGFGLLNVLVPLRLDELGVGAVAIAATFLGAVAFEALMSPLVGRMADRRGPLLPARIGLLAGGVALALLPLGHTAALVALGTLVAAPLLGMLWAPALALLSTGAEDHGLDPALGFGLANLAWGLGAAAGSSGGGALADAAGDAAPYLLLAGISILTSLALSRARGDYRKSPVEVALVKS